MKLIKLLNLSVYLLDSHKLEFWRETLCVEQVDSTWTCVNLIWLGKCEYDRIHAQQCEVVWSASKSYKE